MAVRSRSVHHQVGIAQPMQKEKAEVILAELANGTIDNALIKKVSRELKQSSMLYRGARMPERDILRSESSQMPTSRIYVSLSEGTAIGYACCGPSGIYHFQDTKQPPVLYTYNPKRDLRLASEIDSNEVTDELRLGFQRFVGKLGSNQRLALTTLKALEGKLAEAERSALNGGRSFARLLPRLSIQIPGRVFGSKGGPTTYELPTVYMASLGFDGVLHSNHTAMLIFDKSNLHPVSETVIQPLVHPRFSPPEMRSTLRPA